MRLRGIRGAVLAAGLLALPLTLPAAAQDQRPAATLADVRADLRALTAELQSLRTELNASGAAGFKAAGGDSAIDRMNAMESELSRLTGETERLKNRIDRVVKDGTNRVGDIEFRLCEMEEGCDLGALTTPMLGDPDGAGVRVSPPVVRGSAGDAPLPDALTAQERADLDRAAQAMQAGDFTGAAQLYGTFAIVHAGSPAAAEALFLKGAALDAASDPKGATAAWLSAFSADPTGPRAPDALLGLSRVSATGRPASEGCVYLLELTTRFAGTPQADQAAKRMASAGCDTGAPPEGADAIPATAGADAEAAADLADGG